MRSGHALLTTGFISLGLSTAFVACTDAALQSSDDSLKPPPHDHPTATCDASPCADSAFAETRVLDGGSSSSANDLATTNVGTKPNAPAVASGGPRSREPTSETASGDGDVDQTFAAVDAAAVPTQCELDVEWRDVDWSSPTCITFSPTTGFARGTWNEHGLQLDTAPPHVLEDADLVAAFTCYQSDGLWRYVETIELPPGAANLCDGQDHVLSYTYQECRILYEVSYMCLITEDSCRATTQLTVRRARFAPVQPTFTAPSNLVADAACYNDDPPKAEGAICGDSAECEPGSYCDVSGDETCFVGACKRAPQYLECEASTTASCDCLGYSIPPEIANSTCQANALGIATRPCGAETDTLDAGFDAPPSLDGG